MADFGRFCRNTEFSIFDIFNLITLFWWVHRFYEYNWYLYFTDLLITVPAISQSIPHYLAHLPELDSKYHMFLRCAFLTFLIFEVKVTSTCNSNEKCRAWRIRFQKSPNSAKNRLKSFLSPNKRRFEPISVDFAGTRNFPFLRFSTW